MKIKGKLNWYLNLSDAENSEVLGTLSWELHASGYLMMSVDIEIS